MAKEESGGKFPPLDPYGLEKIEGGEKRKRKRREHDKRENGEKEKMERNEKR